MIEWREQWSIIEKTAVRGHSRQRSVMRCDMRAEEGAGAHSAEEPGAEGESGGGGRGRDREE